MQPKAIENGYNSRKVTFKKFITEVDIHEKDNNMAQSDPFDKGPRKSVQVPGKIDSARQINTSNPAGSSQNKRKTMKEKLAALKEKQTEDIIDMRPRIIR